MAKKPQKHSGKATGSTSRGRSTGVSSRSGRKGVKTGARPLPARRTARRAAAPAAARSTTTRPAPPTSETASGKNLRKYVYCIIRTRQPLSLGPLGLGAEPSPVYTVSYGDLAAVVSDWPLGVLDPTRDNVLAHQRVNETVMQDHTVLPMSFGTVFKTGDDVAAFLKSASDAFLGVLDKMENKLEFGLKVLWDRDAVIEEIESENEDIHRLKDEIEHQKGSTYFARMQYGRLVDAALHAKSAEYMSGIFDRLRDVSVASRTNRPIGDRMILNAVFLVSRNQEQPFDARVKELGARYSKLTFKYTGPWPPYNFVNIRLKLERA
jgi:hypothetical protein